MFAHADKPIRKCGFCRRHVAQPIWLVRNADTLFWQLRPEIATTPLPAPYDPWPKPFHAKCAEGVMDGSLKPSDLAATPQAQRFEEEHGDLTVEFEPDDDIVISAPDGEPGKKKPKDRSNRPLAGWGKKK